MILVTTCILLVTTGILLVTTGILLVTTGILLVTTGIILIITGVLLVTAGILLVTTGILRDKLTNRGALYVVCNSQVTIRKGDDNSNIFLCQSGVCHSVIQYRVGRVRVDVHRVLETQ